MANMKTVPVPLAWEDLPLAYLASSYDGHSFEVDINRYTGIAYVRYPAHIQSLRVVREVMCCLLDSFFFDDLLDDCESMVDKRYGGVSERADALYRVDTSDGVARIVDCAGSVMA